MFAGVSCLGVVFAAGHLHRGKQSHLAGGPAAECPEPPHEMGRNPHPAHLTAILGGALGVVSEALLLGQGSEGGALLGAWECVMRRASAWRALTNLRHQMATNLLDRWAATGSRPACRSPISPDPWRGAWLGHPLSLRPASPALGAWSVPVYLCWPVKTVDRGRSSINL